MASWAAADVQHRTDCQPQNVEFGWGGRSKPPGRRLHAHGALGAVPGGVLISVETPEEGGRHGSR